MKLSMNLSLPFSLVLLILFPLSSSFSQAYDQSSNKIFSPQLDPSAVKAVYSFGDSIADTGNLIRQGYIGDFSVITSYPYGETTFHKATGRCSDGLLMIDYVALAFGLSLINPYLDTTANFDQGVNFAVAGATALDSAFFAGKGILMPYTNNSLSIQLQWFKSHLNSKCSSQPDSNIFKREAMRSIDINRRLGQSLVLMGEIGGNDYNYALIQGKSVEEVTSYVPLVVESIINGAKELIAAGAVRLLIPGNFPIGCMPSYLTTFSNDPTAYDENKCHKGLNSFAMSHNSQLRKALEGLRQTYPHVLIMYADYYESFMHLLRNAVDYGFDKDSLLVACCGTGGEYNFDVRQMCGKPGTTVCPNPAKRISWDGIHLTQEAYKIMATLLMAKFSYSQ